MSKLKIGVIGVGNIAECHISGYKKNPDVELYAFCDINEARVKEKGEKHGVTKLYTDLDRMLAELPELDAVSVCTWNNGHAECTIKALNAGKHVLCEKPMAMNAKEAQAMIDASKKNGKKLMVGFVRRFGNDTAVARDFIDAGSVGDVYYAKVQYLRRNGCPGGWFSDKSRSGGGPLIDLGVHVIDLARYLMGRPMPVSAYGATFSGMGVRANLKDKAGYTASDAAMQIHDVEDLATALVKFDNGSVLAVEASFNMHGVGKNNIELYGTKGGVTLSPEFRLYTEINDYLANVTLDKPTALSFDGLFQNEINYFVESLLVDRDLSEIAEDGCTLMKILDAIYESARCGRESLIK